MILNKLIIGLFFLLFLNGCVQSAALLGPAYTLVSSGNVYQAGLSYGSTQAVKKITGKSPTENIKSLVDNKQLKVKEEEESYDEFFALVKIRIEKTSKIIKLANQ
jgi:phosphoribosylaminoimidazole (AIR) synthetase